MSNVNQCRPRRPSGAERSRQRIEERRRRLAAALRENLVKRKEQTRARQDAEMERAGRSDEPS
ncbi:MAG: hypothetical protein HN377_00210 [Alphaproteobacteria bacterium]|jgi:hypothetical protein|nr:hypothetical protein [Alphaproteobacteria bacterium]